MKKNFGRGATKGPNQSKSKGKSRKEIKNARSLADVLGGGGGRKAGASSGRDSESSTRGVFGRDSTQRSKFGRQREESEDQAPSRSFGPRSEAGEKKPVSKKLTYIMNFQPPGGSASQDADREAPRETRESRDKDRDRDSRSKNPAASQAPTRPQQNRSSEAGGKSRGQVQAKAPIKPGPNSELNRRTDFRWPQERLQGLRDTKTSEDRSRRGSSRPTGESIQGIIKRHPDGYGFLIPEDAQHPDVYISRQSMTGVMTNDRVEVKVYKPKPGRDRDDRLAGEIVSVVARAHRRIVGKYLPVDQKYGMIQDDNRGWGADLRIASKDSMGAKEGDLVAVEVLQYPDEDHEFTGKVVGLLGDIEDPLNDTIRVIHQAGIPMEFSKAALDEARRFGGVVSEAEKKGREDLTDLSLITIDGATARDFDDAIFVEQTNQGFRLVVAIADVSHYVKPGTPLDEEAYARGTSTYFPNFVVPMLPEELSNELCSLKPEVDRLCFCCEMEISFDGNVESYRFFEGVMHSKARVIYGEAQEVIDGRTPPRLKHVEENILRAADLAKILMQKRFREGSLDLEIPETQVVVDASGESNDIIRNERLFAHRLIEELMLVTNICTARFFDEHEIAGIYRIHEEPDPENIKALQRYLWNLGGTRSLMGDNLARKLTKALQSMQDRPESQVLNILTLRTMQQAKYSNENVGHFGLGFSHYSHFTSPIRRYPDLIAHRLIKSQLNQRYKSMLMTDDELASAGVFLSACEQRSVKAERQLISIKKARFIRRFIGEEFDGLISSVAKFGVFVLLRQYDVDGLIKIENLGPDRFIFDDENLRLMGPRSGLRYAIGDSIRVRVVGADPELGKVDFELAEPVEAKKRGTDDDEFEDDGSLSREFDRLDRKQRRTARESSDGADKNDRKTRKGRVKRSNDKKRGKTENDRRGVRKKRLSKRRGKN